jgi:SAM-dependent methyltransferase
MSTDLSTEALAKLKDNLAKKCLEDPSFILYKCDPQTLSFMSDISYHLRKIYPRIEPNIKDVLDVGSRTGVGAAFIQQVHHPKSFSAIKMRVTAIDIEDRYKPYANTFFPEINYIIGDIFELPENSRDIVICSHTIEHVPDPEAFIKQLCKIAREYVIVACPYKEDPKNLIPGHLHSIDKFFIDRFSPSLFEIYTNMHWHQSQACIFAIDCQKKKPLRILSKFFG